MPKNRINMNEYDWYCDECGGYLNWQEGFTTRLGKWKCTNCGHMNYINSDNIVEGESYIWDRMEGEQINWDYHPVEDEDDDLDDFDDEDDDFQLYLLESYSKLLMKF